MFLIDYFVIYIILNMEPISLYVYKSVTGPFKLILLGESIVFFGETNVWTVIAFCGFGESDELDDSEFELWAE
jgi:hypothetical protein